MNRNPDEISIEKLQEAYKTIPKFKDYVEAVRSHGSRLNNIDEILINKTVKYYYMSLLPGECNEERSENDTSINWNTGKRKSSGRIC